MNEGKSSFCGNIVIYYKPWTQHSPGRKEKTYVFDQCTLVLEGVTLTQVVKFVVEVLVNLAGGTILDEQTTQNTKTTHPNDLTVNRISKPNVGI